MAVAVVVASLIASVIVTRVQTPTFEASAQLVVSPAAIADPSDVIRSVEALDRRTVVATFARLATGARVHQAAARGLQLAAPRAAEFHLQGAVVPSTNVIRITVHGPDATQAAGFANLAAAQTAREAEALYRVYQLSLLSEAAVPAAPLYPDPKRNYTVGLAIGVLLGGLAALALDRLRTSGRGGA